MRTIATTALIVGFGLCVTTRQARAQNYYTPCWQRAAQGDAATTITVADNGQPMVTGYPQPWIFKLDHWPTAPVWTWHPNNLPISAQNLFYTAGNLFVADSAGDIYTDSGWSGWKGVIGSFNDGCMASMVILGADAAGNGNEVGISCYGTNIWTTNVGPSVRPRYQTFSNLPNGLAAIQVAGFHATPGAWNVQQLWALAQDGSLYGFDGANWHEQPGWGVTSLTDHYAVGTGGIVYQWHDEIPDFLPNQAFHGNWLPSIWTTTTPNGIKQIAANLRGDLWASDKVSEGIYFAGWCNSHSFTTFTQMK